jgi:hypothetical protein
LGVLFNVCHKSNRKRERLRARLRLFLLLEKAEKNHKSGPANVHVYD